MGDQRLDEPDLLVSPEEAAGDLLAAYLLTVPHGRNAAAWARWRGKNPPPYLRAENRRGDRCGLCGGELSAWLRLCLTCHRREFEYVQGLPRTVNPGRPAPKLGGRTIVAEQVHHPTDGRHRPATSALWFVVRDEDGLEVTRTLDRHVAESYR